MRCNIQVTYVGGVHADVKAMELQELGHPLLYLNKEAGTRGVMMLRHLSESLNAPEGKLLALHQSPRSELHEPEQHPRYPRPAQPCP